MAAEVPHDGNDPERDRGWPLWGATIAAPLDRCAVTVNAAASRLGVRNTTLKRGTIERVQDVVSRAAELAFSDAGARLAGILLADSDVPVQITLRRAYRSVRYPIHLSTYVGVESLDRDLLAASAPSITAGLYRVLG